MRNANCILFRPNGQKQCGGPAMKQNKLEEVRRWNDFIGRRQRSETFQGPEPNLTLFCTLRASA